MKRKIIKMILLTAAIVGSVSSVYCDTKTVNVKLEKNYTNGIFNIVYDTDISECSGYIESPTGEKYDCINQENGYMYCPINQIESGEWTVKLSSEDVIGQVTVNLSANNEIFDKDNNDISIVRKITGLNVYLEDNKIKAEWTDEKCGEVLVILSDSATKETINSEIVSRKYEYIIPEKYENIFITLAPVSLASKDEAKTSFTFSMKDIPVIEVEHNIGKTTNKDVVEVQVTSSEKCTYETYLNNNLIEKTDKTNLTFETTTGNNIIKIVAINSKGHRTVYEYEYEKDVIAPVLTLDNDWSGFSTKDDFVIISGVVEGANTVSVNGEKVDYGENGNFQKNVSLIAGNNEVKIVATDEAGNESLFIMNIEKKVKSSNNILKDVVFIIIFIVFIFLVVFNTGKKKPKVKKEKKEISSKTTEKIEKNSADTEKNKTVSLLSPKEPKESAEKQIKKETPEPTEKSLYSKKKNSMFEYATWIIGIVLIIIFTQFIISIDIVQSSSMEPNIMTGELLFTNRLVDSNSIEKGDIIVFKANGKNMCKRVVGTEGDVITFSQGYVVINGEYCKEEYLAPDIETNSLKSFTVPQGCLFCLGDNREYSVDARYWKNPYIKENDIIGKVVFHIPFLNIFN